MSNVSRFALVIAGVIGCQLLPTKVLAADPGSIGIDKLQSVVKGQIAASGTYTFAKGWTVSSITLYAWPDTGGVKVPQGANWNNGNWNATINGLTSGVLYDVQVEMVLTMGTVQTTVGSSVSKITVQ